MLDTLVVGAIIMVAALFVGRRLYRQFASRNAECGCSGCGQSDSCSTIQNTPTQSDCCGPR